MCCHGPGLEWLSLVNDHRRALRRLVDEHRIALVRRGTGERYASRYRVLDTSADPAA